MGDVIPYSRHSKTLMEGREKRTIMGDQMLRDASNLAAEADADTGLAGYLITVLQADGSWRTCFMHPEGTIMNRTMFAAFVKEAITRDLPTASEVRFQNGEEV